MSILPIIPFLQKNFNTRKINVLEIGARYGESSKIIISKLNVDTYNIIDPYIDYEEYTGDGFNSILKNSDKDIIFNRTKNLLNSLHNNVQIYRGFSSDKLIIDEIPNSSIDLIFIDGNHTYEYVLHDLKNYYPKLNRDGIICGDDFFMRSHINDTLNTMSGSEGYDTKMVYEAVIEFCKEYKKTYSEFGKHRGYGKIFMINND